MNYIRLMVYVLLLVLSKSSISEYLDDFVCDEDGGCDYWANSIPESLNKNEKILYFFKDNGIEVNSYCSKNTWNLPEDMPSHVTLNIFEASKETPFLYGYRLDNEVCSDASVRLVNTKEYTLNITMEDGLVTPLDSYPEYMHMILSDESCQVYQVPDQGIKIAGPWGKLGLKHNLLSVSAKDFKSFCEWFKQDKVKSE